MEFLGVEDYDYYRHRSICPFHNEDTPSFIYDSKRFCCHCFGACGMDVDIITAYMRGQNKSFVEAVQKLFELANIKYSFGEHHVKTKREYQYPKEVLCESKDQVYRYLHRRKIGPATVDYLDIRQDVEGNIAFVYYDLNDVNIMTKYRPSRTVKHGENKNWCQAGADTTPILYNINRINPSLPLLICSGELDCAAAIEAGFTNAVSIPLGDQNTRWVDECWDFLEQFKEIIIAPDNDESGMKYCREITPRLGSWRCKVVQIPEYYEKDDGERIKVKDVNEVLFWFGKEKLLEIIANAKQSEVPQVIDYADIEDFDMSQVDGVFSGLKSLDQKITKLYFGSTAIVTGVAGAGKSSLIGQLVCQTLEQGYNAFVYSGELENQIQKSWIDFVLAGQRNIAEYQGVARPYYKVKRHALDAMRECYRGHLWFYRDDFEQVASKMLETMETMVRRNNCKLCVIDNMTSIDLQADDRNKYFKQDDFIRKVVNFSKKFHCICIVVIHPKKMDTMRRMNLFDLQGVVSSVNLAHYVMALYRVQEADRKEVNSKTGKPQVPEKCDVIVDTLKNRFTPGGLGSSELYYDQPSRRFFEDEASLDFRYKWDQNNYDSLPLQYPPPQLEEERMAEEEVYGEIKGA